MILSRFTKIFNLDCVINGFMVYFETGDRKTRKRKDQTRMGGETRKD